MRLSPRQRALLTCAAAGDTDEATAVRLGVSTNTLRTQWHRATEKLGTVNRTTAVLEAIRRNEIQVPGVASTCGGER